MAPAAEDLLQHHDEHDEKHMLERDLEEEDFEDKDDDEDIMPEEYINPHTGEIGGPRGPEPTRFGDWSKNGRVSDF